MLKDARAKRATFTFTVDCLFNAYHLLNETVVERLIDLCTKNSNSAKLVFRFGHDKTV